MNNIKIINRFFQLDMKDLAYVKFIIESYEGIAIQRTLNPKRGEIEVMIPECNMNIFDGILKDLESEVFIKEIKKPVDYCSLVV